MTGDLAAIGMGAAGVILFLGFHFLRKRRWRVEREELLAGAWAKNLPDDTDIIR